MSRVKIHKSRIFKGSIKKSFCCFQLLSSERRVLKQDDCGLAGLAGKPGRPERSDPGVNVCVRAGSPGQVRAGRDG
uniref:Uncharacterized protein n=1 Tax=Gouania willdenowi TaxID=441366 RepID=A0A8C5H1Q6_GOUWI